MLRFMMSCSALAMPSCSISSLEKTARGKAPSSATRLIKEPVTVNRSSFVTGWPAAVSGAGAVWAWAAGIRLEVTRSMSHVADLGRVRMIIMWMVGVKKLTGIA